MKKKSEAVEKADNFEEADRALLHTKFHKVAPRGIIKEEQFKSMMGILGLESASFLSTRIFKVIDKDGDGNV